MMSTRPSGTDRAPNFVVFVQSSLSVIATATTAPDVIRIVEGFGGAADDRAKIRAGPSCLQKEIVGPPERQQPALDSVLRVFSPLHVAQALGDDGANGRDRILDTVVQLFKGQLLQLVGRLALPSVDAGLGKQTPHVDLGLR